MPSVAIVPVKVPNLNRGPVTPEQVDRVLQMAALEGEGHSKLIVVVRTGRLRSSIATAREGPMRWAVKAQTDYAFSVELRKPYLRPSADRVRALLARPDTWVEALK